MKRDFLRLFDLTPAELDKIVKRALELKKGRGRALKNPPFSGKTAALIFEKSSTRTRVSFEVGVHELGGDPIFLSARDMQIGRGEPVKDTARVLSGYVHLIIYRCFAHDMLEELAKYASVPVINGLSDLTHPVQVLSDIFTIYEHFGRYKNINMAWIGDGNNMANAWLEAHLLLGFPLKMACPERYNPDADLLKRARKNKNFMLTTDPAEAVKGCDVLNTDVWISMGDEAETVQRKKAFRKYQINKALLDKAGKKCVVLHCLPAYRGQEITDDVIESKNSLIFTQSENRLHAQKALMEFLVKK
jgi:ornithine carbamoyltransferase